MGLEVGYVFDGHPEGIVVGGILFFYLLAYLDIIFPFVFIFNIGLSFFVDEGHEFARCLVVFVDSKLSKSGVINCVIVYLLQQLIIYYDQLLSFVFCLALSLFFPLLLLLNATSFIQLLFLLKNGLDRPVKLVECDSATLVDVNHHP